MSDGTINNEKGIVLVLVLFIITILSLIALGASRNIGVDTAIASNYLSSQRAFYIAEAGLERGKIEAIRQFRQGKWPNFTKLWDGTTLTPLSGLTFNTQTSFLEGSYTVTVANNKGDGTADTDLTVTITSVGLARGARSTVVSTIKTHLLPPLPAGVTFVGAADVSISGNAYTISGDDTLLSDDRGDHTGTAASIPAVSLCDMPVGYDQSTFVSQFNHDNLTGTVDVNIPNPPPYTKTLIDEYIEGLVSVASPTTSTSCNTTGVYYMPSGGTMPCKDGSGILIVDGDLTFNVGFSWKGVIFVRNGTFRLNGNNEIWGGVVLRGEAGTARLELNVNGNVDISYSMEAIELANSSLTNNAGKWSVLSWQRL